jgi:hypothetical protein
MYLFLQEEGMNDTLKSLQQESKVPCTSSPPSHERAVGLTISFSTASAQFAIAMACLWER